MIYSLKEGEMGNLAQEYEVDLEKHDEILDIVINSYKDGKPMQNRGYACQIAC